TPPSARYGSEEARREWQKIHNEFTPTAEHTATAEAAAEWAKSLEIGDDENSYLANVNTVARSGTVTRKAAGIAASIIIAHKRAMDEEIKRREIAKRPASTHIGKVGKREIFQVTVEKVIRCDGQFGTTGIHKM